MLEVQTYLGPLQGSLERRRIVFAEDDAGEDQGKVRRSHLVRLFMFSDAG